MKQLANEDRKKNRAYGHDGAVKPKKARPEKRGSGSNTAHSGLLTAHCSLLESLLILAGGLNRYPENLLGTP